MGGSHGLYGQVRHPFRDTVWKAAPNLVPIAIVPEWAKLAAPEIPQSECLFPTLRKRPTSFSKHL